LAVALSNEGNPWEHSELKGKKFAALKHAITNPFDCRWKTAIDV
jgi:hypothetical protein